MRWRDVKKGKSGTDNKEKIDKENNFAAYPHRVKALIVDLFMIYMPILYILTYFVLDGKEDFQNSPLAPLIGWSLYGLIYAILLARSGQTPGKRAYDIQVLNDNDTKLSFFKAILRYLLFLFSASIIIGVLTPFFRKDKKALHDIILGSKEIDTTK